MSEPRRIVSDTGPLISLEKLTDGYAFIRRLYDDIVVPGAVLEEVAHGYDAPSDYIEAYGLEDLLTVRTAPAGPELPESTRLHEGETQAIRLALQLEIPLLIEEKAGRRVAQEVGVQISGLAGQVLKAFRHELLSTKEAQVKLAELLKERRINEKLYEHLIEAVEETA